MFFNKLKELVEKSKKKSKQNNEIEKLKTELEKEINNIKIDNNDISEVLLEVGSLYSELKPKFSKEEDDEKYQKDIADKIDSLFHQKISKIKADDKEELVKDLAIDFALIITAMSGIDVSSVPKFVANMENKNYDDIASRLNFLLKKLDLSNNSRKIFNEIMELIDNKLSEVQKEVTESIRGSKITVADSEFKDCRNKADWQQVFQEWIKNGCKNDELRKYAQEIGDIKIDDSKGWPSEKWKKEDVDKLKRNIELILKETEHENWKYRYDKNVELTVNFTSEICVKSKDLKQELKNEKNSDLAVIMTYIHNMTKWAYKTCEAREDYNYNYKYKPEREKVNLKNFKLWDSTDGPKANDIKQLDMDDCYFESVLKSLVSSYDFRKCFVGGVDKENGSVNADRIEVRLFKVKVARNIERDFEVEPSGQQIIEVDSSVFLNEEQKNYIETDKTFYWPYVLNKAYAIMRTTKGMIELGKDCDFFDELWKKNVRKITNYSTKFINWGYSCLVQCALTGRKAKTKKAVSNERVQNDEKNVEKFLDENFDEINKIISQGGSITVSFSEKKKQCSDYENDFDRNGLMTRHEYSVVKAGEDEDDFGEFLYLEDPTGGIEDPSYDYDIKSSDIRIMEDGIIRISKDAAKELLADIDISE